MKAKRTHLSEVPGTELKNNVCMLLVLEVFFIFFSPRGLCLVTFSYVNDDFYNFPLSMF